MNGDDTHPTDLPADVTENDEAVVALSLLGESVGIWIREDVDGNEEYWSPRFYELLGHEVDEIPSTLEQFKTMLHPSDHERTFKMVDGHFAGECDFAVDYRVLTKSKGYRWFRGAGSVSRAADGSPLRMVGSIMDIHDGMRAIRRLEALNEDLEHFIQIAAHDLREPARRQLMLADFILEDHGDGLEPDVRRLLDESQKQSRRTLDLLGAAQTITTMQNRWRESEEIELMPLIDSILDEVLPSDRETDISIDVPPTVRSNWGVLHFLFDHLIANAVRHGPPHVGLTVTSREQDGHQVFSVANHWSDDAQRSNASLERLASGETASDRFGMRLGLSKRAAVVLGGDLWLAPTQEAFRVEFTVGDHR